MSLKQDVRYSFRVLRKNLTFSSITVIVIAVTISAVSTIFSVFNTVILQPLPYKNPEQLTVVWATQSGSDSAPVSGADFLDWKSQAEVFDDLAAYSLQSFNMTEGGEPERIDVAIVSANFLQLLNVKPILGRPFMPDEVNGNRIAVLSEGLWKRRFGADTGIIGRVLKLNEELFEVVGVMPSSFQYPGTPDLWVNPRQLVPDPPIVIKGDITKMRGLQYLGVIGRLKPGVNINQAEASLGIIVQKLKQEYPDTNEGRDVRLVSLYEETVGDIKPTLFGLMGAVIFVLLISSSNIANLLLGRSIARQKEFSIRMAMGASRRHVIQQLLTESIVLSLIAGGLGLLLAYWGIKLLLAIAPSNIPRISEVSLDGSVIAFTMAVSILTGIAFGLSPILSTIKTNISGSLKESNLSASAGPNRHRLRKILVISEVALSLVLLIGAGLMLKSFYQLQHVDLGFNTENVLTMQISLPRSKYSEPGKVKDYYNEVLERIKSLPGVTSVGATNRLPLAGTGTKGEFIIEGRSTSPEERVMVDTRVVTPDFFTVMRIPLKEGRLFAKEDINGPRVVIINESAVKQLGLTNNPIGKRISSDAESPKWVEIIGVVGDVRGSNLYADPKPELYFPHTQSPWNNMTIVARLDSDMHNLVSSFRSEVLAVDKNQPSYNLKTMEERVQESISQPRFSLVLLLVFAVLALTMAATGLYGVMIASVAERKQEIGIRMALGAQPKDIIKMVVAQGMLLVTIGIFAGGGLAFPLAQSLSSLFFRVSAVDISTYLAVSGFLILITLIANVIPAYRASKIDPLLAIRNQ